jgi:HAE1 family hydrophobic/amphiphilic exporter-1
MAVGIGTGSEMQASLARVVLGGLVASTLVTLVFIPTLYVSCHELVERRRRRGAESLAGSGAQPAPGRT